MFKKVISMVLALTMVCGMATVVMAEESAAAKKLGQVTVDVVKVWEDEDNAAGARPESVAVTVGEEVVVLSEENGWQASVVVEAFDSEGATMTYAIAEEEVEDYITAIDPEELAVKGFAAFADLNAVRNCNTLTKYLDGYNMAIFKKGNTFVIWTEEELTANAQAGLKVAIENAGIDDLVDLGTPSYVVGFEAFDLIGQEVAVNADGSINFEGHATWSWFYRGTAALEQDVYEVTVTNTYDGKKYDWVQVGEDSATGLSKDKVSGKKSWFMYNTFDVAAMEIGEAEAIAIQAGNNKNGENIVGCYTLEKVAEDTYKIQFAAIEATETEKVELTGEKLWINASGEFENSPGNQKGLAEAVAAGEEFTFEGDTLYVFAHFNAAYYEWQEIVE